MPFVALLAALLLSSCSSIKIKSQVEKSPLIVHKLAAVSLTEKASIKAAAVHVVESMPWRWRGRDAIGAPPQSFIEPIFLNEKDVIVVTLGGGVSRFDTWIGHKVWDLQIPIGVGSQVAVEGSALFVAGMDRVVRKLDLESGRLMWTGTLSAEATGGIALGENLLYVTASDNSLWCLDKNTGKSLWTYKRPNANKSILWSLRGSSRPVLSSDGRTLFVGFADGYFVSLDALRGDTRWERSFDRPGRFVDADTPAVLSPDGAHLYLALVDGDFHALSAGTGKTIWKLSWASHAAPLVDFEKGVLYYSTNDSRLVKASLKNGTILWISEFKDSGLGSTPVQMPEGFLALSTTGFGVLMIREDNGKIVYRDRIGKGVIAAPSFKNGKLLVLSPSNDLLIYKIENSSGG